MRSLRKVEQEMTFEEGKLVGEKEFRGRVFPKTFVPLSSGVEGGGETCRHLADMVKEHRAFLWEALEQHGALLFRGFHGMQSAEDFSRVVAAFGWDEMPYEGAACRIPKAPRVLSANEAPVEQFILFHHEMTLTQETCSKVVFFCVEPPPEDGQTSILPSERVVERMEEELPEVMSKLSQVGILKVLHTKVALNGDKLWQQMLKTSDEEAARKKAMEKLLCQAVEFNPDGTADLFYGPMNPIREFGGKRVWFHTIQGYESGERDGYVSFGDGGPIPSHAADVFDKILEESCVDVAWQKGDLLLLDNQRVQHARRAGKPPRSILVSLFR